MHHLKISPVEKVTKILTMLTDGFFTEGASRRRAEDQARLYMRSDKFVDHLLSGSGSEADAREKLVNFRCLLQSAGLQRDADDTGVQARAFGIADDDGPVDCAERAKDNPRVNSDETGAVDQKRD